MTPPSTICNSHPTEPILSLLERTRVRRCVIVSCIYLFTLLTIPKLISTRDLSIMKTFIADTPLNTASITPKKDFVILGGGQAAMDVTTTSARQGKFEARFYHKIFEDEIGRVRGHFGPLNTIAVHPQGTAYASGGEDGYVRMHHFDKPYLDFMYEVEREQARK